MIVPGIDLKPLSSARIKRGQSDDPLFDNSQKQDDEGCKIPDVLDSGRQKQEITVGFEEDSGRGKRVATVDLKEMEQSLSVQEEMYQKEQPVATIDTEDSTRNLVMSRFSTYPLITRRFHQYK